MLLKIVQHGAMNGILMLDIALHGVRNGLGLRGGAQMPKIALHGAKNGCGRVDMSGEMGADGLMGGLGGLDINTNRLGKGAVLLTIVALAMNFSRGEAEIGMMTNTIEKARSGMTRSQIEITREVANIGDNGTAHRTVTA